jgi:mono/diheme cytochrome c family protein
MFSLWYLLVYRNFIFLPVHFYYEPLTPFSMKKFFKYLMMLIGIVIVIVLSGAAFIAVRGIPSYPAEKPDYKVEVTPARVERGKKLAMMLCVNCHKDANTGQLTGEQMLDAPAEFGKVFSQNITQDKTYGIGSWTDGEILFLLRTGIKRDGKYAPPYMAKLPHMSDEDIASVIAFLRSDDPLVAASATVDQPCQPTFLTKFLCAVAFKPLKMPNHAVEMPDTTNPVELGRYLVYNLECWTCHSADFKTMNIENPNQSAGYLGGGNKPLNKEGKVMLTQNITPDPETGIGNWTEEMFVNAVKSGLMQNAPALRYPMVPFAQLTDYEAKSIFAYLKTVPPIKNKVERSGL